jgi:hypothetical protein
MADEHKIYVINSGPDGKPISGRCAFCKRLFQFEDTPDQGRQVEEAFHTTECEDASQAAAG